TPEALDKAPASSYAASFIDAGTIVRGRNARHGGSVEVSHLDVDLQGTLPTYLTRAQSIAAVLPRNRIKVSLVQGSSDHRNAVRGTVERCLFTGSVFNIY